MFESLPESIRDQAAHAWYGGWDRDPTTIAKIDVITVDFSIYVRNRGGESPVGVRIPVRTVQEGVEMELRVQQDPEFAMSLARQAVENFRSIAGNHKITGIRLFTLTVSVNPYPNGYAEATYCRSLRLMLDLPGSS